MPPPDGAKNDTNVKTAQMVRLISEIGPDIPEISRRLGQFKESVRYRYKEKIVKKGLAVQAMVDHERLGLRRMSAIVGFGNEFGEHAESILTAMSELCYVVGFERILPEGTYIVHASVPTEALREYTKLLAALRARGVLSDLETFEFDWFRNVPWRAEFYDFDLGLWDYDWSSPQKPQVPSYRRPKRAHFDYIDLLLLKELQIDATRSLMEIAKKINKNYKTVAYHQRTHVVGERLVKGYTINWMGTSYASKIEKALHRRHRYLRLDLLVHCKDQVERMSLPAKSNSIPFLWAEAGGKDYLAEFAFPVDSINEALEYLSAMLDGLRGRAKYLVMDQARALAFSIPYKLYDEERKAWTFDGAGILERFGRLEQKILGGSGASS